MQRTSFSKAGLYKFALMYRDALMCRSQSARHIRASRSRLVVLALSSLLGLASLVVLRWLAANIGVDAGDHDAYAAEDQGQHARFRKKKLHQALQPSEEVMFRLAVAKGASGHVRVVDEMTAIYGGDADAAADPT
eukprot:g2112.t1